MNFRNYSVPYAADDRYAKRVAYFSMEYALHQPLKIYSGGLGFLAGSHLRSAFELKQNLIGIGILWKYGYYDQSRNQDQSLNPIWMEKNYSYLEDTGIKYQIVIHGASIWVKAYYLPPTVFNSAPLFLLSTDMPENDHMSQTICHKLYDANVSTKLAQCILLGVGGAKLIDELNFLFRIGRDCDMPILHIGQALFEFIPFGLQTSQGCARFSINTQTFGVIFRIMHRFLHHQ